MRVTIYLLAFANLILFALAGGLNGGDSRAAPHLPANELSPDRIVIVSRGEPPPVTRAASAKPAEAHACLAWPDISRAQGDRIALAAEGGGVLLTRETTVAETSRWWVRIPSANGGKAAVDKKAAELRKLGIKRFTVVEGEGESSYVISFGRFDSEAEAQKVLDGLRQKTVRSAKVVEEGAGDGRERLLARGPADRVEALRAAIEGVLAETCDAAPMPRANGKDSTSAQASAASDAGTGNGKNGGASGGSLGRSAGKDGGDAASPPGKPASARQ
jgi:hypothetical protein